MRIKLRPTYCNFLLEIESLIDPVAVRADRAHERLVEACKMKILENSSTWNCAPQVVSLVALLAGALLSWKLLIWAVPRGVEVANAWGRLTAERDALTESMDDERWRRGVSGWNDSLVRKGNIIHIKEKERERERGTKIEIVRIFGIEKFDNPNSELKILKSYYSCSKKKKFTYKSLNAHFWNRFF